MPAEEVEHTMAGRSGRTGRVGSKVTGIDDTVVVVTGAGALSPDAVGTIPHGAIILAADAGLDHALAAGLIPAGLIGDLDSVSADGLAWAKEHATIQRHPADKDATDTELALSFAADMNPAKLILLSGAGDRLDHTIAAIGALGNRDLTGVPIIEGWCGDQHFHVVHGPSRITITTVVGTTLSVLALHGKCTGVSLDGVAWPLLSAELAPTSGQGVSNIARSASIDVALSKGVLTIFTEGPPA